MCVCWEQNLSMFIFSITKKKKNENNKQNKKLRENFIFGLGLFSKPAIERIRKSNFEKVVVCNTVPLAEKDRIDKIEQLSIAPLLALAIERIHFKQSVSQLFSPQNVHEGLKDTVAKKMD